MHHDAQTGIQRVVRAVWADLNRRGGQRFECVPVFASAHHGYCEAPADFFQTKRPPAATTPVRVRPGDKFLGLDLSAHLLPKYLAQVRSWRKAGATIHLVVYDLLPITRPDWFNPATSNHFRRWFELLKEEADQAFCISNHVADELRQQLAGLPESKRLKIGRLQMGGDIEASLPSTGIPAEQAQLIARLRFRPAILMVGTIEPRKGYEVALAAFDHLWRTFPAHSPDLVIVGKSGWKTALLQKRILSHPQFGRRLHWLSEVSDEGLCQLYGACRGLLMASYGEGFGLPLIEAAMHQRHLLARDVPVFREQKIPGISYFTDDSPAALGEEIVKLSKAGLDSVSTVPSLPTWADSVSGLLSQIGLMTGSGPEREAGLRHAS